MPEKQLNPGNRWREPTLRDVEEAKQFFFGTHRTLNTLILGNRKS